MSRAALHLLLVPQLRGLSLDKCPGLVTSALCAHIAARCQVRWSHLHRRWISYFKRETCLTFMLFTQSCFPQFDRLLQLSKILNILIINISPGCITTDIHSLIRMVKVVLFLLISCFWPVMSSYFLLLISGSVQSGSIWSTAGVLKGPV